MTIFGSYLSKATNLLSLSLNHIGLSNETFEVLSKCLVNLTELEELSIEKNNINDEFIKILTRPIKKLKKLHTLSLRNNNIKDLALSFQVYIEECGLNKLYMKGNSLSARGLEFIGKGLSINDTIDMLEIEANLGFYEKFALKDKYTEIITKQGFEYQFPYCFKKID